jgi:hypothetical protein
MVQVGGEFAHFAPKMCRLSDNLSFAKIVVKYLAKKSWEMPK